MNRRGAIPPRVRRCEMTINEWMEAKGACGEARNKINRLASNLDTLQRVLSEPTDEERFTITDCGDPDCDQCNRAKTDYAILLEESNNVIHSWLDWAVFRLFKPGEGEVLDISGKSVIDVIE